MFELLVTLCLDSVCEPRVLPNTSPMSQAECQASMPDLIAGWQQRHEGYTLHYPGCVDVADLGKYTASVQETSPGHFVHTGQVAEALPENSGDIANTGFIIGGDAVAVIDSGSSRVVAEALYLAVRKHTNLPIRWHFLTHMHPDHTLGSEVFREAGAEIIGHATLAGALAARNEPYQTNLRRILGDAVYIGTSAILPDRGVQGTEEIDLGGRIVELRSHPTAHTSTDLSIFDQSSGTIWMGDLVFLDHVPALDGSISGWIKVLSELDPGAARQMVPGHGPAIAAWPDGVMPTLNYLQALADQTRAAIGRDESLITAIKHLGGDLRGDWKEFDNFNARNATNAYVELEWE